MPLSKYRKIKGGGYVHGISISLSSICISVFRLMNFEIVRGEWVSTTRNVLKMIPVCKGTSKFVVLV